MTAGRLIAPALLLALLGVGAASAHDRTTSYSQWELHGRRARVTVRLLALDVSRFPWAATDEREPRLASYLTDHLRLTADGAACAVTEAPRALAAAPGWDVWEWQVGCPETGALAIRSDLLLDLAPAHLHFARLVGGATPGERVLTDGDRRWALATDVPRTPTAGYVRLGVEHIVSGWDHLAFLVALLLIGGSLGGVARVVTGFTAAHSITLAVATLGWVQPARAPVEAMIGLSIALVAAENVWLVGRRGRALPAAVVGGLVSLAVAAAVGYGRVPALTLAGLALFSACYFGLLGRLPRPDRLRWGVAFLFGLVHGFGFAAVLIDAHLDAGGMALALLGFNVGVELGQLGVVVCVWPLLRLAAGRRPALIEIGSAAVAGLGVFWFVSRAFG